MEVSGWCDSNGGQLKNDSLPFQKDLFGDPVQVGFPINLVDLPSLLGLDVGVLVAKVLLEQRPHDELPLLRSSPGMVTIKFQSESLTFD